MLTVITITQLRIIPSIFKEGCHICMYVSCIICGIWYIFLNRLMILELAFPKSNGLIRHNLDEEF